MRPRPSLVVAVASGLCGLVLGLMLGRPSTAQPPAPVAQPQQAGRYQISLGGTTRTYVVLVDTVTGRCWSSYANGEGGWDDLGVPPGAAK
jgi:hypothetical protein